jgi:hypothetical protein
MILDIVENVKIILSLKLYVVHGPTAQNKHGAHYAGLVESDER